MLRVAGVYRRHQRRLAPAIELATRLVCSGTVGGLGDLPCNLEADGHRLAPSAARAALAGPSGASGVGHDRGAIELAGGDERARSPSLERGGFRAQVAPGCSDDPSRGGAGRAITATFANVQAIREASEQAGVELIPKNGAGPACASRIEMANLGKQLLQSLCFESPPTLETYDDASVDDDRSD